MRNLCNLLDINNLRVRISKCFDKNRFGVVLDCPANLILIKDINKGCADAIARKRML